MNDMGIKVAIIGVGNCAKALVEGVAYYSKHKSDKTGLIHPYIGNYHASEITFVAAFDIDKRKVGLRLHEAINAKPNQTIKIADPFEYDVIVQRGPTYDSVIPQMREQYIIESDESVVDVVRVLKAAEAEIVLNYLPTGSDKAAYAYAEASLEAGCSYINCMPTPMANIREWAKRFEQAGLVLLGDDIKSQCGATIVNRLLLTLFKTRGLRVLQSEQINYGGNADHYNLHFRPESKEKTKEAALKSVLGNNDSPPIARMVYVEGNYNHKRAEIRLKGEIFGHVPISIAVTLEDEDSPNSAGVVVDAIRAAKILIDRGKVSEAKNVSPFLMKAPPTQVNEFDAIKLFHEAIGFPNNP